MAEGASGSVFHHPFPREVRHRHRTGMQMDNSCPSRPMWHSNFCSSLNDTKFVRRDYIFYWSNCPHRKKIIHPFGCTSPFPRHEEDFRLRHLKHHTAAFGKRSWPAWGFCTRDLPVCPLPTFQLTKLVLKCLIFNNSPLPEAIWLHVLNYCCEGKGTSVVLGIQKRQLCCSFSISCPKRRNRVC